MSIAVCLKIPSAPISGASSGLAALLNSDFTVSARDLAADFSPGSFFSSSAPRPITPSPPAAMIEPAIRPPSAGTDHRGQAGGDADARGDQRRADQRGEDGQTAAERLGERLDRVRADQGEVAPNLVADLVGLRLAVGRDAEAAAQLGATLLPGVAELLDEPAVLIAQFAVGAALDALGVRVSGLFAGGGGLVLVYRHLDRVEIDLVDRLVEFPLGLSGELPDIAGHLYGC